MISAMLTLLSVKTENTAYIERQEFNVQDKMNEIVHMLSQHLNGVEFAKYFHVLVPAVRKSRLF